MRSRRYGVIGLALATLWISGALYMTSSPWQATGYLEMTVTELYPEEGREPLVYCSAGEDAKALYTALSALRYEDAVCDCSGDLSIKFSNGKQFSISLIGEWARRGSPAQGQAALEPETWEALSEILDIDKAS